jgi:hypothetical protein
MNFRRFIIPAAISAGLLAAASIGVTQAVAHHAFAAEFDGKSPVLLRGKVVKVEWINPHAWVHVNVVGPDGKETEDRHRDRGPRLPVQGQGLHPDLQGQRPRRDLPGRPQAVHGLVRNGRAEGWRRRRREALVGVSKGSERGAPRPPFLTGRGDVGLSAERFSPDRRPGDTAPVRCLIQSKSGLTILRCNGRVTAPEP